MAKRHVMTPARRAALRKAQKASARKRRGKGKGKLAKANRRAQRNRNIALATGGLAGAALLAGYGSISYSKIQKRKRTKVSLASSAKSTSRPTPSPSRQAALNKAKKASDRKRQRTFARYSRISWKVAARGMYNSGLSNNVGGRTFVAGWNGIYRR